MNFARCDRCDKRLSNPGRNSTGYCQACLIEMKKGKRFPCTTPGCRLTATEDAREGKCNACRAQDDRFGITFVRTLRAEQRHDYDCAESPTRRHYWEESTMGSAWYWCHYCNAWKTMGRGRLTPSKWASKPGEKRG